MQTPKQILNHSFTKQGLQEKHQMQIKKTVKTLSKEMQRPRKILKLLFKQVLEKFTYAFD